MFWVAENGLVPAGYSALTAAAAGQVWSFCAGSAGITIDTLQAKGAPRVGISPEILVDIASALQPGFTIVVFQAQYDVAFAISEVGTHHHGNAVLITIAGFSGTVLAINLKTFEVVAQDEVGNSTDSVGTVHGRSTTGDGFNALHQRRRDAVDVSYHQGIDWSGAFAVDKYQAAVGAEAAQ